MENRQLITVVVPIFNVEKYLSECVESIIQQSYDYIEIILVDDGSTDTSGQICDEFQNMDDRIKVIHKKNGGLSDARNAGIDASSGNFIAFVDSDDYIENEMIERLYTACVEYNADISMCGRRQVWEDGRNNEMFCVERIKEYTPKAAIEQILLNGDSDSAAWDKLYKAELFKNMRYPVGVLHEDLNVTSRLFAMSNKIVKIPYLGYNYRMRMGSITKQGFKPKKMDLLTQTNYLCDFVTHEYPELDQQAKKFYCFTLTNLMTLLISSNRKDYRDEVNIVRESAKKALRMNIGNRYLSVKDKARMAIKIIQLK